MGIHPDRAYNRLQWRQKTKEAVPLKCGTNGEGEEFSYGKATGLRSRRRNEKNVRLIKPLSLKRDSDM